MKKLVLFLLLLSCFTILVGCKSLEQEAYSTNQKLIADKFPVPKSLKFPKFEERFVLCSEDADLCSVKGRVEYKNQYGVMVTADYESIVTYDDDYFYLYSVDIYER